MAAGPHGVVRAQADTGPPTHCPECGDLVGPERFCGHCGALLHPHADRDGSPDPNGAPRPNDDPESPIDVLAERSDAAIAPETPRTAILDGPDRRPVTARRRPDRRVVALIVLGALLVTYLAVELRPIPEVVAATSRGGPLDGTRVSSTHAVTDLSTVLWVYDPSPPVPTGTSSLLVAADAQRLLLGDDRSLRAYDASTMRPLWSTPITGVTDAVVEDGRVSVVTNDGGLRIGLDRTDGHVVDRIPVDEAAETVVALPDDLTVVERVDLLVAYKGSRAVWSRGREWEYLLQRPGALSVTPLTTVVETLRIGPAGEAALVYEVLDTATGRSRWTHEEPAELVWGIGRTEVRFVDLGRTVVRYRLTADPSEPTVLTAHDAQDGTELWSKSLPTGAIVVSSPSHVGFQQRADETVEVVLLDERTGRERLRTRLDGHGWSAQPVDGGLIASRENEVQFVPLDDTDHGWTWEGITSDGTRPSVSDVTPDRLLITTDSEAILVHVPSGAVLGSATRPSGLSGGARDPVLSELGLVLPIPERIPVLVDPQTGSAVPDGPHLAVYAVDRGPIAVPGGLLASREDAIVLLDTEQDEVWDLPLTHSYLEPNATLLGATADAAVVAHWPTSWVPEPNGVEITRHDLAAGGYVATVELDADGFSSSALTDELLVGSIMDLTPGTFEMFGWSSRAIELPDVHGNARLVAVDLERMTTRWARDLDVHAPWTAIVEDDVVVGEPALIVVLDASTGDIVHETTLPVATRAPIAVAHERIVQATATGLIAVDRTTGEVAWHRDLGVEVTSRPTIAGRIVYAGTIDGRVVGLRVDDGAVVVDELATPTGIPVQSVTVAGGQAIIGLSDGRWLARGP